MEVTNNQTGQVQQAVAMKALKQAMDMQQQTADLMMQMAVAQENVQRGANELYGAFVDVYA
ncbi:MAG: putative motility protein [Calditrichaeota bacterium]|nr:MAG: putative motility protein [Calditrichota bacterium]